MQTMTATEYRKVATTEHGEQSALIERCAAHFAEYPELRLLYAIPNGGERPSRTNRKGQRYSPEGNRLKQSGQKTGVPDLCLPIARHGYHALYIEMKKETGRASSKQLDWVTELEMQGNRAVITKGQQAAWDVLVWYLGG